MFTSKQVGGKVVGQLMITYEWSDWSALHAQHFKKTRPRLCFHMHVLAVHVQYTILRQLLNVLMYRILALKHDNS